MSTIVLRNVKGSPLTNTEVDDNFSNLNTDKLQFGGTYASGAINAVVYLNGSKVLSSSAALTFDGTTLATGVFTASQDSAFTSTGALQLPSGTTAQRPTGTGGKLRFNSSTGAFEGHNGSTWSPIGGGGVTSINGTADQITASASTGAITLSLPATINVNTSGTATNATYVGTTQQINTITGKQASMSMSQDGGATQGSFVCRATGTGDANLAGMTFWNDSYAIKMGIRADGYFGLGGWSRAAWSWYSDPSGNMVAAGNVTAYSDERLKKNWRSVPVNFIERLAEVKSGIYDRIDEEGLTQIGVSAQSLQKVMPEAVIIGLEDTLTVSYGNAALVSSVELAKRIIDQEARIKKLESLLGL